MVVLKSLGPVLFSLLTLAPLGSGAPAAPHTVLRSNIRKPGARPRVASNISAVWANDGGDKVTQDELRVSRNVENLTGRVKNRVWDGSKVSLFAAKNESVSFQLTLEAAVNKASGVSVNFNVLSGPNNWKIRTGGSGDPLNFVNRWIEVFYERYVKVDGLSFFGYSMENSQIPVRFRSNSGQWVDRPDHDKMYPDALVPMELVKKFDVAQGTNQSVWVDVFVPKRAPAGVYRGSVKIYEGTNIVKQIPVELTVNNFTLPDSPTAKTMLFIDNSAIEYRYVCGNGCYAQWNQDGGRKIQAVMDKYYQFLHRHRMSAIGENECPPADQPCDSSLSRLDGSLFTPTNGYDGPGIGTPNGVYSIGTYGTWGSAGYQIPYWKNDQNLFNQHMAGFGSWFQKNSPKTDVFLYLQDEPGPADFSQVQTWASWLSNSYVKSFSTVSGVYAMTGIPSLSIAATSGGVGNCPLNQSCNNTVATQQAHDYFSQAGRKFWMYNDGRPGTGTFDTESDGVDPRTIPVAQYKMGVDRWYYWLANTNGNFDPFLTATTWNWRDHFDPQKGMWSDYAPANGNGLLIYPGTNIGHDVSYGINGPIASIRLKNWRRGIEDADYFAMADKVDHVATQAILNSLYPKAIWENTVGDVSWPIAPISWSSDPDVWENARFQLSQIILRSR